MAYIFDLEKQFGQFVNGRTWEVLSISCAKIAKSWSDWGIHRSICSKRLINTFNVAYRPLSARRHQAKLVLHCSRCKMVTYDHTSGTRRKSRALQPADIGWSTGNGKKLSCIQAQLGQATCLAVALFLSISCGPSYVRRLYMFSDMWLLKICTSKCQIRMAVKSPLSR